MTRTGKRINIPLAAVICPVQQLTERYIPTGVDPPLESDTSVLGFRSRPAGAGRRQGGGPFPSTLTGGPFPSTLTGGRNTRYAFIH